MGTRADFLATARADLGLAGRPNKITRDYSARHGDGFLRAPWCDMAVTYWARKAGVAAAVLPGGDRAYTVWHAEDFRKIGRWREGTAANIDQAEPGDIVFFDWGGSNTIGAIDHVGVIEKVLGGGRVQTIEGNTGDAVRRRIRSAGDIAGYGRPIWTPYTWSGKAPSGEPVLARGDAGDRVRDLQHALLAAGEKLPQHGVDGGFGAETEAAVRSFQRKHHPTPISEVTGRYGPQTAAALADALAGTPPKEDDMLSDDDVQRIARAVWELDIVPAPRTASTATTNPTWKGGSHLADIGERLREITATLARQQPGVDEAEVARLVLAGLTPAAIADAVQAALPQDLARQVVDELGARLGS